MCVKNQLAIVGRTHHMLVSVWGKRWREVQLVFAKPLTTYIDDAGTDPSQKVALATGFVVPGARIPALEREWDRLKEKEHFSDFHMAEFSSPSTKHPDFAGMDAVQKERIYRRVRQITKKFGVQSISFAVRKDHYDAIVPDSLKKYWGKHHYTWAVRQFISYVHDWQRRKSSGPLEYVFDWMKSRDERRKEIEDLMDQAEEMTGNKGEYSNYSFRHRAEIPGLQCVDALAWISYQVSLLKFYEKPLYPDAKIGWDDFKGHLAGNWRESWAITKANLEKTVKRELQTGESTAKFKAWEAKKKSA